MYVKSSIDERCEIHPLVFRQTVGRLVVEVIETLGPMILTKPANSWLTPGIRAAKDLAS